MTAKENGITFPRKPPTRAADAVTATLEAQIMSGALASDTPLPTERELIKQFNTSRTVIREAIATLSYRGLLESKPRFRPIVRKPDYTAALSAVNGTVGHLLSAPGGVKNLYESRVFSNARWCAKPLRRRAGTMFGNSERRSQRTSRRSTIRAGSTPPTLRSTVCSTGFLTIRFSLRCTKLTSRGCHHTGKNVAFSRKESGELQEP